MARRKAIGGVIGASALAAAVALGVHFEGERTSAYADIGGVPTICYGHTRGVQAGDTASHLQCTAWLRQEMGGAMATVQRCIHAPMSLGQLAALTDAAYNLGPDVVCGSTLQRLANSGDMTGACRQLPRWVHAGGKVLPGLVKRRNTEMHICLGDAP